MSKEEEMPGFYMDPKTGKRKRETLDERLEKFIASFEHEIEKERTMNITGIIGYLRKRELGSDGGPMSEKEYFRARLHNKQLIDKKSMTIPPVPHLTVKVNFIKGDKNSVYGLWKAQGDDRTRHYIISKENFWRTICPFPNTVYTIIKEIADLCHGPVGTLVGVYNFAISSRFPRKQDFIAYFNSSGVTSCAMDNCERMGPLQCCTSIKEGESFVVGGNGCARIFIGFDHLYDIHVDGKVHTLSCDDSAKLLILGTHEGAVYVHDLETKKNIQKLKVSNKAINDSVFVDKNQVIVADVENNLMKLDLRVKDVVAFYYGHKTSVKKRPFSYVNNLLCATGTDNVIRIWHVSGGNPLLEMRSLIRPESSIRGWLRGDCNNTYLDYFDRRFKWTFKL